MENKKGNILKIEEKSGKNKSTHQEIKNIEGKLVRRRGKKAPRPPNTNNTVRVCVKSSRAERLLMPPLGFQPAFHPNIAGRRQQAMFGWKAG